MWQDKEIVGEGQCTEKMSTERGDTAHTFLKWGHNWGGGKIYAGRGEHSTYIVDGGNNWVWDAPQHSKMELSVAIMPLCSSIL